MGDPTYDNAADLDGEGIPAPDEAANDDEGMMVPRDDPGAGSRWGTTADEARRGETVRLRATQEVPEVSPDDIDERDGDDGPLRESLPAGQLIDPSDEDVDDDDTEPTMVARQGAGGRRGDGIALSAEEDAVHLVQP